MSHRSISILEDHERSSFSEQQNLVCFNVKRLYLSPSKPGQDLQKYSRLLWIMYVNPELLLDEKINRNIVQLSDKTDLTIPRWSRSSTVELTEARWNWYMSSPEVILAVLKFYSQSNCRFYLFTFKQTYRLILLWHCDALKDVQYFYRSYDKRKQWKQENCASDHDEVLKLWMLFMYRVWFFEA